jgi:hypothetical protein
LDRSEFSADDRRAILEELDRILSSPSFRNSARCREFLRFVVERTLAGESEALKERTIAVEHFGKSFDVDLDRDSTVRVCARNARRRLAEYYAAGASGPFRIELPVGSYVPVFRRTAADDIVRPDFPMPAGATAPPKRWPRKAAMAAAAVALSAVALALFPQKSPPDLPGRFWKPALAAPGGVEVLIASPPGPPSLHPSAEGAWPALPGKSADAAQASAVAEILHFLRNRGAQARIGDYRQIQEEEIPGKAVVIVGASAFRGYHAWMKDCPIQLHVDENPPHFVSDIGGEWPQNGSASDAHYAAIYRIPDEKPRPFILLIAGLTAHASEIAVRHLVEGGRLADLLRNAPAEWETARMVLLLEVRRESARPISAFLW